MSTSPGATSSRRGRMSDRSTAPTANPARHLGRLAPDERAVGGRAAGRDARHDRGCHRHVQSARGEVVEKEEWLGPLE
eukprot:scaffold12462_cov109-Isochrysis_galbana.AAC.1